MPSFVLDQPTKPKKKLWKVVKRAFTGSRCTSARQVSTQPDQESDKDQDRKPVHELATPYKRHVFYKRPVPHPSDPAPPRGFYLSDPRPAGECASLLHYLH